MAKKPIMANVKDFDSCPNCGSTNRFAESLYKKQVAKGLVQEKERYGIHEYEGPIVDMNMLQQGRVLIGTKIPCIKVTLDVCKNCGTLYAVRITNWEVRVGEIQTQQLPPGLQGLINGPPLGSG